LNNKVAPEVIEVFVVIKEDTHQYYLLKVQRKGFDVYCFHPGLGAHHTVHESGVTHFTKEPESSKPRAELPIMMFSGEAGTPHENGFIRKSLKDLGAASCIYHTIYQIDSLSKEYKEFNRSVGECFVIDKGLFSKDAELIEIGVWAVPARNEISFQFNNPDIPAGLLYKVTHCDPQIWIYARPF
jgi:hypothetical protein